MSLPTLITSRLRLRPFTLDDAPTVQQLAGAYEVAVNTLVVPHPYDDGMAEEWIATHESAWEQHVDLTLAIALLHPLILPLHTRSSVPLAWGCGLTITGLNWGTG